MNNEKKVYVKPEADVLEFRSEDIIVTSNEWWSGTGETGNINGPSLP